MYGRPGSYTDVTDELRDYATRGESFRVSPEAFGLDRNALEVVDYE